MQNDKFSNEIQSTRPSNDATDLSKTTPYGELVKAMAGHQSRMKEYQDVVDNVVRTSGSGSHSGRFQDVFYGLNKLPQLPEVPMHRESQGLILFTRPELNLAYDNISPVRQLSHLLTQDVNSAMNAIKLALDPITQRGGPITGERYGNTTEQVISKLTDKDNPYIALLSNTCISMSNPPDLGINLYTSPEGRFKEQWMMNDSISENNGYYDLTCTFSNIKGNSVVMMLLTWVLYMGLLRTGPIGPHPHNRIRNRMDYFTRIERYKLDESGKFIEQWFHTGASVPKNISIGAPFGLNRLEPMEFENKEVSVQFGSVGAMYNDPIQLWELNKRMIRWNPSLGESSRKELYFKVPMGDHALTNHYSYPLINLATRELEWWVLKNDYRRLMKGLANVDEYSAALEASTKAHVSRHSPMAGAKLTPGKR